MESSQLEASVFDRITNKFSSIGTKILSNSDAHKVYNNAMKRAIDISKQNGDIRVTNMLQKLYKLKKIRPIFQ